MMLMKVGLRKHGCLPLVFILLVSDSNCADEMNGETYYSNDLEDRNSYCL